MADVIYSDKDMDQLEKNSEVLSDIIKTTHEKFGRNKDNRDARLLIEAVNSSNESIHKKAANMAKMEAAKSLDGAKDMVTDMLLMLSSKSAKHSLRTTKVYDDDAVVIPLDVVDGEMFIGPGSLELTDLKLDKE